MPKFTKIEKSTKPDESQEQKPPQQVVPSDIPKQHPQQRVDLSSLIKTGEENKNNNPVVPVVPVVNQKHVITEQKYKETPKEPDKWEKTSVCDLPGDIEIVNMFHYNKKSGNTQVFIVLQDRKVVGVSSIRLEV